LHWSRAEHAASEPPYPRRSSEGGIASTYAGNDTAANAFRAKTGIDIHRWDLGSFNNAGFVRDSALPVRIKLTATH
jgi:hypothetical protein